MNARCRRTFVAIAAAIALPSTAPAQDTTRAAPWLSAISVGFPALDGEMALMAFTIGGNFTKIRPGALSPDFSFGTMPIALSMGMLAWGARAGVALPLQSSTNAFVMPSAGLSMIGVAGPDGGGAIGTNVGLALVSRTGARIGVTWHRFGDGEEGVVLLEIGVGRVR